MKTLFIDRETFWHAEGLAYHNKGGWAINYITIKARQKYFKNQFCGNLIKADLKLINLN